MHQIHGLDRLSGLKEMDQISDRYIDNDEIFDSNNWKLKGEYYRAI